MKKLRIWEKNKVEFFLLIRWKNLKFFSLCFSFFPCQINFTTKKTSSFFSLKKKYFPVLDSNLLNSFVYYSILPWITGKILKKLKRESNLGVKKNHAKTFLFQTRGKNPRKIFYNKARIMTLRARFILRNTKQRDVN